MPFTSADIAAQMLQQLRVLDPAMSGEPGTPERKIIDTVAVKVAEAQLDLSALQGGFNIDSKFGANLDRFLAMLNFGRQQAVAATGFVTFSRPNAPATADIRVPAGTRVIAPDTAGDIVFRTTFDVVLKTGDTSIVAPVIAVVAGNLGNVAANRITQLVNVTGIYAVTNVLPTSGGLTAEDDDEFKTRFKNTVFRNVSGTVDQYLALAVATPFTTKANVVGPISRYREYMQVPDTDDATASGNGSVGEWTTSLSTIPYSKHVYDTIPFFLSNGKMGSEAVFFRPDADFRLNTSTDTKNRGDAYRQATANPGEAEWDPTLPVNAYRPSVTLLNIYQGAVAAVTGVRPADVLLFEHSYMSSASRNDWARNITNCVDVFIDGESSVVADAVVPLPTSANAFVSNLAHRYHFENFRRSGQGMHRPVIGNLFTPLFFEPVTALPDMIAVDGYNYYLGYHYWLVEDVSELGGTVRARNGIEWSTYLPGQQTGGTANDPTTWTGPTISASAATSISVGGYTYDKNINDLQAALDSSKQTTTDVLAHKARRRYFKLDITVMYRPGVSAAEANATIRTAVQGFLEGQYFGSAIQLSDLLNVIHNVSAVDNVRWSRDVPSVGDEIDSTRNRVIEVNADGSPHNNAIVDTIVWGKTAVRAAQFRVYFAGEATDGTATFTWGLNPGDDESITMNYTADPGGWNSLNIYPTNPSAAANLQTQLRLVCDDASLTVTGQGAPATPFIITFSTNGVKPAPRVATALTGGPTILNTDFYLTDDELPSLPDSAQSGDSVAGLIIRPRAQSTWVRL